MLRAIKRKQSKKRLHHSILEFAGEVAGTNILAYQTLQVKTLFQNQNENHFFLFHMGPHGNL